MLKKIVSIILSVSLFSGMGIWSFATQSKTARLYSVYGDGMLFEQNEEAVFSGIAAAGSKITAQLFDSDNALIAQGTSTTSTDGVFTVCFDAPAGSFEEYSVVLTENSAEFAKLNNVVFGELWLASGQSNMMYPLAQSRTGIEMHKNGETFSKWLRVLLEPAYPEYNGADSLTLVPADPQPEIIGAEWITGENEKIYGMSAVAFFFATEMLNELNMPVGILNSSLGGSALASWLSREAIDGCEEVKNIISSHGRYTSKDAWVESEQSIYQDITSNFNLRTNALKNFRPSGMIWYQGETDLMFGYSPSEYTAQLELLQKFYTEHFSYKKGLLPLIYTQLAPYFYSDKGFELLDWNIEYTKFQADNTTSRAVITNYDVPLTFIPEVGFIHPQCKEEIGERMAFAAKSLVYGKGYDYTAAYPESYEISGADIFVTLKNTGDGMQADGNKLYGFAVCDSDGIFVEATAEIISKNTIKIHSDNVSSPVAVSYAYCVGNYRSNLYSTQNGTPTMPVSPFVLGSVDNPHYWVDKPWTDCEDSSLWHNYDDEFAGYYSAWKGENAKISFNEADCHSGTKGLNIKNKSTNFSVYPVLTYNNGTSFRELDTDYSDYGVMSFYIRNNGTVPVTLENVSFYKNSLTCYIPADSQFTIPADGQWHSIELNMNTLYVAGYDKSETFSNNILKNICDIKFNFTAEADSDISLDNISFAAQTQEQADSSAGICGITEIFRSVLAVFISWLNRLLK